MESSDAAHRSFASDASSLQSLEPVRSTTANDEYPAADTDDEHSRSHD